MFCSSVNTKNLSVWDCWNTACSKLTECGDAFMTTKCPGKISPWKFTEITDDEFVKDVIVPDEHCLPIVNRYLFDWNR